MATKFYNNNWRMPRNANQSKASNFSMDFDGTDDYVYLGTPTELNLTGDMSISAWIYTDTTAIGTKVIVCDCNSAGNASQFCLEINRTAGKISALANGASVALTSSTSLSIDTWYHVVLTRSGSAGNWDYNIYLDGLSDGSANTADNFETQQGAAIGRFGESASGNFDGKIDHVAIFDYALTLSEVQDLFGDSTDGVGNPMVLDPKPKAYYPIGDYAAYNGTNYLINNGALNDYVFDFGDASSRGKYINTGYTFPSGTTNFTASVWFKPYDSNKTRSVISLSCINPALDDGWTLYTYNNFIKLRVNTTAIANSWSRPIANVGAGNYDWMHLAVTYDTSVGMRIYLDNVYIPSNPVDATTGLDFEGVAFSIGFTPFGYTWTEDFEGDMTNVAIFNSTLPTTGTESIDTLYNNGSPNNNIGSWSDLQGWWKLDSSATFDGTNWSIPDDSTNSNTGTSTGMTAANLVQSSLNITTPFSRYALDFDGVDGKINLSSSDLGINCCISFWVNLDSGFNGVIIGEPTAIYNYTLYCSENSAFNVANATTYKPFTGMSNVLGGGLASGSWNHIVINRTGDVVECFLNGISKGTQSGFGTSSNTLFNTIGGDPANTLYQIEGSISNISAFNTTLSAPNITTLYNQGKPSDLSSFSPAPVAWWQLGENSYFDGSDWIVLDEIGTNNGTSSGMTEDDLVNGVNTTANGVSSGMGTTNIIGDAPYSTANAVSYNMSVTARETSTP